MTPDTSADAVSSQKWAVTMRRLPADEQAGMLLAAQTLLRHPQAVLHGTADAAPPWSAASSAIAGTLQAIEQQLTGLSGTVRAIDTKLGVLLDRQP